MSSSTISTLQGVDEKTASVVTSQRDSILSRLHEVWQATVSEATASQKMWVALAAENNLSLLRSNNSPHAERIKTEKESQYLRDLAADTFKVEVTKRVGQSTRFTIKKAPGGSTTQLSRGEFDLSSAMASGQDPDKYIAEKTKEMIDDRVVGMVQGLTLGWQNAAYPSTMASELADNITALEVLPAAKASKADGSPSDFDRYLSEFEGMSRAEVEKFYDQTTGKQFTRGPPFTHSPIKALNYRLRPFRRFTEFEGSLSGPTIASATGDGRLFPSWIEKSREVAEKWQKTAEVRFLESTGKNLSEIEDHAAYSKNPSYLAPNISNTVIDRLEKTLLSNAQSSSPLPLEALDLTEAFTEDIPAQKYKGLYGALVSFDKTFTDVWGASSAPFYALGAVPDQRAMDIRGVKFNLVDESRDGAPKELSDFWPKSMSEVSKVFEGEAEAAAVQLPEKYADTLLESSLTY
ncbi:hypothetical protein IAT38_008417 [Cryptococcus sp. DSM 104549]